MARRARELAPLAVPERRAPAPASLGHLSPRLGQPGLQLVEQRAELLGLLVAEPGAQARVVADRHVAQPVEPRDPRVGELDALDAPVALLAPAPDQALRLERVAGGA